MRARGLLACLFAMLAQPVMPVSELSDEILYTRADVTEATSGEVEFRRAYSKRLSLPQADCEGEAFDCVEDRIYGQVYSLTFYEERVSRRREVGAASERRPRGKLLVAMDLSPDAEDVFEEALSAHLEALGVASYSRPFAGMGYPREPIDQGTLVQSSLPAWVCKERDGEYTFDLLLGRNGEFLRSYSRKGDVADRACREIESAVQDSPCRTLGTMPLVLTQTRHTIRLQSASTLSGLTWADQLASIPAEVTFEKQPLEARKTGAVRDRRDGVYRGHEGRYNDVERDVLIPAAALSLVEVPMWVTRWRFETVRETFGARPDVVRESSASIVIAVVPIVDPLMPELSRTRTALHVPEERLVQDAIAGFERSRVLEPSVVEDAFADPETWPAQGDWVIVSCHDDASARYGIAPFSVVADVTNPREVCAAIVREIGQ